MVEGNGGIDVIRIKVGRHMIDDPNKAMIPIPDFWFDKPFVVEVEWVEPAEGLLLTLSDFRMVSFDADASPERDETIWPWDPDFTLEPQDERGNPVADITFSFSEAERDGEGVSITNKTLILAKRGSRDGATRQLLVLFKQTLSQVLFEIDPPWVGKPPVG